MQRSQIVHVLDTDPLLCAQAVGYLVSNGLCAQASFSAAEVLDGAERAGCSCLVMDLAFAEMSGMDMLSRLADRPDGPSVVFLTGASDVGGAVQAMKAGAVEVLPRPVDLPRLLSAVQAALERNERLRSRRMEQMKLRHRFETLTARERQVLPLVVGGLLNKQAASVLGIAEITLQMHRAQIMRKMQAESLPDLVRMAMKLGVRHAQSFRAQLAFRQQAVVDAAKVLQA